MEANERYLQILEERLARHLAPDVRGQRIQEIRAHLAMDQAEREAEGLEPHPAALAARRALGSPEVLARQMIRQARGYDSASPWRLALPCGIALTLALAMPFYFLERLASVYPWNVIALHWPPMLVLAYFGYVVIRTRRWLVLPMAGWAAVATIGACVAGILPPNLPKLSEAAKATEVRQLQQSINEVAGELKLAEGWNTSAWASQRAPVGTTQVAMSYWVPFAPFDIPVSRTEYVLTATTPREAPGLWKKNVGGYEAQIHERLASLQFVQGQVLHPTTVRGVTLVRLILTILLLAAEQTVVFAGLNWLLLAISGALMRRRTRRDPLLA